MATMAVRFLMQQLLSVVLIKLNIYQVMINWLRKKDMIKLWKKTKKIMLNTKKIERNYLIGRNRIDEIMKSLFRILKTLMKL